MGSTLAQLCAQTPNGRSKNLKKNFSFLISLWWCSDYRTAFGMDGAASDQVATSTVKNFCDCCNHHRGRVGHFGCFANLASLVRRLVWDGNFPTCLLFTRRLS